MEKELTLLQKEFKALFKALPAELSFLAAEFFDNSFRLQGFLDASLKPWAPRKAEAGGRAILISTGALRGSVYANPSGSIARVTAGNSKVPYAKIHNEGGTIPVTVKMKKFFWAKFKETKAEGWRALALSKSITIPARQFMGDSKALDEKIGKHIDDKLNEIFDKTFNP